MVIRTGVIGFSEGNGHPFSFSAIINGYNDFAFAEAGWPVILDYLRKQPADRFGIGDARVTHAWTQDPALTARLCSATRIEHHCTEASDMIGEVDAVIIARDDWESHSKLALPFLRNGTPVFIDKPLTLDSAELSTFMPYLERGKLMSCSGLRYAKELDELRVSVSDIGSIRLVAGTVLNSPEKYGIHLIEAVAGLGSFFARPVEITRLETWHDSFILRFENELPFHLDCLGSVGKTFHLSFFGDKSHRHYDLHDNFSAFRRTLEQFFDMVRTSVQSIDPVETMRFMRLLSVACQLEYGKTAKVGP
jgi:hypothetical protein